jgi:hypothetical protein
MTNFRATSKGLTLRIMNDEAQLATHIAPSRCLYKMAVNKSFHAPPLALSPTTTVRTLATPQLGVNRQDG